VESLQPVDATPLDMHEEVCSNNRRRQPTEDGEEGGEAGANPAEGTNGEMPIVSPWSLRGVALLTSGLAAGIPPVEVYTGPVRNNAPGASPAAAPVPKKKPLAVAAKPPAAKPAPAADPTAKPNPAAATHAKPAAAASVTKLSPGKPSPGSDNTAAATAGAKARPAAKTPLQITPKTDTQ
jgi:D-alanyl-D-alanine carboxypeptidase